MKRHLPVATAVLPLIALSLGAWTRPAPHAVQVPSAQAPREVADTVTSVQMQNVDFYVDPEIPLRISKLRGKMRSRAGGTVMFDDKRSFVIEVESAEAGLTGPALSALLNKYVFNYRGSPITNLKVTTSGNQIIQKGTLHKIAALPFEITATLSITPDGRIKIHPTRTEIIGLHVDKLMSGLGLPLDKIINLSKAKGATVSGNDIYLSPTAIIPPPEIKGKVSGVRVEKGMVVMTFGSPASMAMAAIPDTAVRNYMYYKGGTLQFGKLMMLDADLLITELDTGDPFHFDLDRYKPQLVAGYSRTLESGGLEVWMRDVDKLGKAKIEVTSTPQR
jgi:hypothetical protein